MSKGDYRPLDLNGFYNAGQEFHCGAAQAPIGLQTFRGLPFDIGGKEPNARRCFIGFSGEPLKPITIPINGQLRNLIFAHALLESHLEEGEAVGRLVARYLFRFENGEVCEAPIRERFEIGMVPGTWGQYPFLAFPDSSDWLYPRAVRPASEGGRPQTEAGQGTAQAYYLWPWRNPHPDLALESLRIEPGDRKFLIAGITLGLIDEDPLLPLARQAVKITLPPPEDASLPFNLDVSVDRGVATYPYPLPQGSIAAFLNSPMAGFGEEQNPASNPAYVEIAAVPSATVMVKAGDEMLGQASWKDLQKMPHRGRRLNLEVVDPGKNWVRVKVLDGETGQPVPCRIHFRSPEGIPFQPHGHHQHVNANLDTWHVDVGGDLRLGQITYAYIDGRCEGWLPRGEVIVDIARGFEYKPLRTKVNIEPGQQSLTLTLKRITDMKRQRWFSGDTHVHFLGTQGALFEAQAEDLNVINLLQSQWAHLFTNVEDFTGRPATTPDGDTIVYCSQENRQHMLGHLHLLGLKEPVYPFCNDGAEEAEIGGSLDTTLSAWADRTHEQGGLVVIPHFPNPNGEHAALIATGRSDAIELTVGVPYGLIEYYRYLNGGYRLPLVGGTDKMDSAVPVGLYRTYAYIPEEQPFDYASWCQAVRSGRTFLSGGPLLSLRVNGANIGDTLQLPPGGGTLEIEAEVLSIFPMHTLEIIQQGRVAASTEEAGGSRHLVLRAALKVDRPTWLAARCSGPGGTAIPHYDIWSRGIFAHTSPIYVAVGESYRLFSPETYQYMLTLMEGSLAHIRQNAILVPPERVTHQHGESDHQAFLERPILEGMQAVRRHMRQTDAPN